MGEDQYARRLTIFSAMPGIQILLGIWLLASIYLIGFDLYEAARITAAAVGPFITGFAITRLAVTPPWFWVGWVTVVLGAVVLVTPFIWGLSHLTDITVNFVVVGILVIVTGILGQFEKAETGDHPVATH